MGLLLAVAYYLLLCLTIFKLYIKLTTGWCYSQVCLKGKTAIITGGNSGIGYETAIDLAKRGARVIIACRSKERAEAAVEKIKWETHNENVHYRILDLASFASVRKFAEEINATEDHLDILVNNAGIFDIGYHTTEDGMSRLMQTNYFSPFLLTHLFLDLMKKSKSRIVNVSSLGAKLSEMNQVDLNSYQSDIKDYMLSKLCNVMFTIELASRLSGTSVTTYSLHPGVVRTEINKDTTFRGKFANFVIKYLFKNATEGAQTSIYCAVANDIERYSGEHFSDCKVVKRYKSADNMAMVKKLWKETERILKI